MQLFFFLQCVILISTFAMIISSPWHAFFLHIHVGFRARRDYSASSSSLPRPFARKINRVSILKQRFWIKNFRTDKDKISTSCCAAKHADPHGGDSSRSKRHSYYFRSRRYANLPSDTRLIFFDRSEFFLFFIHNGCLLQT